jgi:hypothetical protein
MQDQTPPLTTYLVIGDQCWGRGKTEAEAIKVCRENSGQRGKFKTYITYLTTSGTRVDEMGYLCRPENDPQPIVIRMVKGGVELPID